MQDLMIPFEATYRIDPQSLAFDEPSLYHTSQGSYGDVKRASFAGVPVAVKKLRIADNTNLADVERVCT